MGEVNVVGVSSKAEKKKFLKRQILDFRKRHANVLCMEADDGEKKNSKIGGEREKIAEILNEQQDLLSKRAIVGDIKSFSARRAGKEEKVLIFDCKYGLKQEIRNLNSFIDFCSIHGLVPLIDKVTIEIDGQEKDISEIKELYGLFNFAIFEKDPMIANIMANEIEKVELELGTNGDVREVMSAVQNVSAYTTATYQYLLGPKLQKLKNHGTLSENIFTEIALRVENQIREKVKIESSYIKLGGYADDTERKTDMHFVLRRTKDQAYQCIPTQFTIGANGGLRKKKEGVEKFLLSQMEQGNYYPDGFLILAVNGRFKENFSEPIAENKLAGEYQKWVENPEEREKNIAKGFPLFINTIDPEIVKPAEVMYAALHMLYKKYKFRKEDKASYLAACKKKGKIDRENRSTVEGINAILLSDIEIEDANVEQIKSESGEALLKHEYRIKYQDEPMGTIVVYAM